VDALKELATLTEQDEAFRLDVLADVQRLLEDEIGHGSPVDYSPKKYDDISDPQVAALNPPVVNMDVGYGRLIAKDKPHEYLASVAQLGDCFGVQTERRSKKHWRSPPRSTE
jgi:hypothetical protein